MRPLRDKIYQKLRQAIIRGDYAPGERLPEETLARELGASRTPIREALQKLETEKLLEYNPNKGMVVSEINTDETEELYQIRMVTEAIIAKRAATKATPEDIRRLNALIDRQESGDGAIRDSLDDYNTIISEIADCPQISEISKLVRETLIRMIYSTALHPKRRKDVWKEHREIVLAIAAKDGELAYNLTMEHVRKAGNTLK